MVGTSDLRAWAGRVRSETRALYLAVRDPRTPWYARALGVAVVAYALSPIDLIPDFIPVLGYADDILIVPLGLWLVRRLIPGEVLADARRRATEIESRRGGAGRGGWAAAAVIVAVWIAGMVLATVIVWRAVG